MKGEYVESGFTVVLRKSFCVHCVATSRFATTVVAWYGGTCTESSFISSLSIQFMDPEMRAVQKQQFCLEIVLTSITNMRTKDPVPSSSALLHKLSFRKQWCCLVGFVIDWGIYH